MGKGVVASLRSALPFLVVIGLALLLEAAVRAGLTPRTIVGPSQIFEVLAADRRNIWFNVEPTLFTASTGLLIAAVLSFLLGFLVYGFRGLEAPVLTVAAVLTSIPMIAIAPALTTLLGLSMATRAAITAVICAFPMIVATIQGLGATSRGSRELFTVLAASPWQRFRMLALPSALPYLFLGAKIAAPLAVLGALIAEWTGAEQGLGVYMINAMFSLNVGRLWASVVVACALSMAAYGWIALAEMLAAPDQSAERHGL
jgi:ABC-type nitrate/sulfonate/bicarbonate transport system permease component